MGLFRRSYLKRKHLERVLVHTRDRTTIEGLLAEVASDGLVLKNAKYLDAEDPPPLHGETFIPHERVGFLQVKEGQL